MATSGASATPRFMWAIRSDVGLVRHNNEDCAYASDDLLILADGMGGHSSGEVASVVALRVHARSFDLTPADRFTTAAQTTRLILQAMSDADPKLDTMGTTLTALAIDEGGFHASHIGDSRLYTLSDGELNQVTTDHTHVQHLVELRRITREQASSHPYRAMLLKSIDDQPGGAAPDFLPIELNVGQRILLCSDGLSDYVPENILAQLLTISDRDEAADALVAAALRAGTKDNVTVIVADVTEASRNVTEGEATYVGAATDPMRISREAAHALKRVLPDFDYPLQVDGVLDEHRTNTASMPLTPTDDPSSGHGPKQASPLLDPTKPDPPSKREESLDPDTSGSFAGLFAGFAVVILIVAIWFLL